MSSHSKVQSSKTLFGSRLREAQREAGISNRELAQAMDISESLLGKWKRGDSHPSFENAARLAQTLAKPLDFFTQPLAEQQAAA
jgi:transcriptional regulator with XRE-family HTH domain